LDLRGRKQQEAGVDSKIRSFITPILHQMLLAIKSRWMIWTGYVAHMDRREFRTKFWLEI